MIYNQATKSALAQDWASVRKLCKNHPGWLVPGGGFTTITPHESFYNLPFVLAYAVLDQVLNKLIEQHTFQCPRGKRMLGDKMVASKDHLPWQNYKLVEEGKNARNDLAHEARLLDKSRCLVFIDAIEAELKSWGVI